MTVLTACNSHCYICYVLTNTGLNHKDLLSLPNKQARVGRLSSGLAALEYNEGPRRPIINSVKLMYQHCPPHGYKMAATAPSIKSSKYKAGVWVRSHFLHSFPLHQEKESPS